MRHDSSGWMNKLNLWRKKAMEENKVIWMVVLGYRVDYEEGVHERTFYSTKEKAVKHELDNRYNHTIELKDIPDVYFANSIIEMVLDTNEVLSNTMTWQWRKGGK